MSDINYKSFADIDPLGDVLLGDLIPPSGISDTLKFSNAKNGSVVAGVVKGGAEDCADFNRFCQNLRVCAKEWHSGGQYVATIKGGVEDIGVAGPILTHGRVIDVDIDNYSDQSHKASSLVFLNLSTPDGSPVRWRSWMGCRPTILNPGQRYECAFRLPWIVGVILNRGYQLLKILHICP